MWKYKISYMIKENRLFKKRVREKIKIIIQYTVLVGEIFFFVYFIP
jgi:hypothetical protein